MGSDYYPFLTPFPRPVGTGQTDPEETGVWQENQQLRARVERLELITTAMAELLARKKVASADELDVLTQQIDLLDGREDGKISREVRGEAPRCVRCTRFLNPRRRECIYCHTPIVAKAEGASPYRGGGTVNEVSSPPTVQCAACRAWIPRPESYFTDSGLRCGRCFTP